MDNKINFISDKKYISKKFAEIGEYLKKVDGTQYFTGEQDQSCDSCGFIRMKYKQFRLIVDTTNEIHLYSRESKKCSGYKNCNDVEYVIENNQESYKVKEDGKFEGKYRNIEWDEVDYRKILINLLNKSFELQEMEIRI